MDSANFDASSFRPEALRALVEMGSSLRVDRYEEVQNVVDWLLEVTRYVAVEMRGDQVWLHAPESPGYYESLLRANGYRPDVGEGLVLPIRSEPDDGAYKDSEKDGDPKEEQVEGEQLFSHELEEVLSSDDARRLLDEASVDLDWALIARLGAANLFAVLLTIRVIHPDVFETVDDVVAAWVAIMLFAKRRP